MSKRDRRWIKIFGYRCWRSLEKSQTSDYQCCRVIITDDLKILILHPHSSQNITDEGINNLQELGKLNLDISGSNVLGSQLQSLAFIFRW